MSMLDYFDNIDYSGSGLPRIKDPVAYPVTPQQAVTPALHLPQIHLSLTEVLLVVIVVILLMDRGHGV
jgi:hypothetical protein